MRDGTAPREDLSSQQPSIILVSGAPGSGKTTVARALAQLIGYPLISKDPIKESLFESLGALLTAQLKTPAKLSRILSEAAMEVLWSLVPGCPEVILEANFRPKSEYERGRIAALPGRKLEVYCRCSPQEAARRFAERAIQERHHPAHSMKTMSVESLAEYEAPMGLCPVIEVDTNQPVNVGQIIQNIREHWPDLAAPPSYPDASTHGRHRTLP